MTFKPFIGDLEGDVIDLFGVCAFFRGDSPGLSVTPTVAGGLAPPTAFGYATFFDPLQPIMIFFLFSLAILMLYNLKKMPSFNTLYSLED